MNRLLLPSDIDPLAHPLDAILADIAVNIQLPPSLFEKATGRYEAVRDYAQRDGSPLRGPDPAVLSPKARWSIDATISNRGTDDEYDLDIVAELDIDPASEPDAVLDVLADALDGYPTSEKVDRQTRCVTLRYADRMHLDVTPAARLPGTVERGEPHLPR